MANTGFLITVDLIKVVDGGIHDGEALDDNNYLCSETGLPQSEKLNVPSDPDYIAKEYNITACPIV